MDFLEFYSRLAEHRGVPSDLRALRWMASRLPNFTEGRRHRQLKQQCRKILSKLVREAPRASGAIDVILKREFDEPGPVNFASGVVAPAYDLLWAPKLSLRRDELSDLQSATSLLDDGNYPSGRINIRRIIEAEESLRTTLSRLYGEDWEAEGPELALYLTGRALAVGTIALSTGHWLKQVGRSGTPHMPWPPSPTHSTVHYVNRVCHATTQLNEMVVERGTVLRCPISTDIQGSRREPLVGSFGSTARPCLGRSLTIALWRIIGTAAAQHVHRVASVELPELGLNSVDFPAPTWVHLHSASEAPQ